MHCGDLNPQSQELQLSYTRHGTHSEFIPLRREGELSKYAYGTQINQTMENMGSDKN